MLKWVLREICETIHDKLSTSKWLKIASDSVRPTRQENNWVFNLVILLNILIKSNYKCYFWL